MEKASVNWYSMTNPGILSQIGQFIQDSRLQQNKTQQQLADAAGISRSTVSQLELGNGATLLSLIQILRVLGQLAVLQSFEIEQKISPLKLAKLEQQKRKRARRHQSHANTINMGGNDW